MSKIFLGGTCNWSNDWRAELTSLLTLPSYNPFVKDWKPEMEKEFARVKQEECNVHLYVITKEHTGYLTAAEIIDSGHMLLKQAIVCIIDSGFDQKQLNSWKDVLLLALERNVLGGIFKDVQEVADFVNKTTSNP